MKSLHLEASGMAFDPQTGESYQLNASARIILTLLRQDLTIEKIAQELVETYPISYSTALTDVMEFQVQLKILGLIGK